MSSSPLRPVDSDDTFSLRSASVSAYPFPSSAQSRASRRDSNASILSAGSIGGSLDIHAGRTNHTVKEAGQNAISTLLQPPIVRTGLLTPAAAASTTYRAPTTRDIPPVTLTNVPKVDSSSFKDYLSRVAPLFDNLNRLRAETQPKQNDAQNDPPQSPRLARLNSAALLSPQESPQPRRRSSAFNRRRLNEPTPLSTIPNVYFDENFQLENPRTFDVVSERAEIAPGTAKQEQAANGAPLPPRKALSTNAILQEKLSWYMDTVEVHLISSISSASSSFFTALGSLRDLEHEAADSVAKIQKLRRDLAKLDQEMAMGGLEVANLRRKHQNMKKLGKAVDQVARVVESARNCEDLVEKGEYDAAAEGMLRLDRLIIGQPEPSPDDTPQEELLDLRSLTALQGLSDSMNQLRFRIGKGFESRFMETLLSDVRRHIEKVPPKDTLRRWATASQRIRGLQNGPPAYMETNNNFRRDILAALHGLSNSGQTAQATSTFREAVMKEMKHLIRKHLPSSSDDDNESVTSNATRASRASSQQEKSITLARNLRALDEDSAEEMIVSVYTDISEALRRLSVQIKVLLDVTSTMEAPEPLKSPNSPSVQSIDRSKSSARRLSIMQEELNQALDMSSLLGQAVDVAQTQIVRILKVRSEQVNQLPLQHFLRYFTINRLFADECEAISGRSGTQLKGLVNTQINTFVRAFGDAENQRIAQTLDSDQWEAKDFNEKDQAILSRILDGMSSDPAVWLQGTRVWEDMSSESTNGAPATNGSNSDTKSPNRPANIDDTRYILVSSAISLLRPIDSFLSLIASIPSITSAAVPALIDVLRTFNSRTSQLILGAGATRIAGLKNITTKHLALASQALSFVIAMSPYLREAVRRHIGPSNKAEVLGEFDKLKRLYQDHQMAIHDKLVEIMTARASSHVNAMKKIDFDAEARKDVGATSAYMETLTKETGTLHRVLGRHLSEMDVTVILSQIFASYKEQWLKAFDAVDIKTAAGKQRLLKDAQLFDSKLSKIAGFGDMGKTLISAVEAKKVQEATPAPPPKEAEKGKEEKSLPKAPETNGKEKEDVKQEGA